MAHTRTRDDDHDADEYTPPGNGKRTALGDLGSNVDSGGAISHVNANSRESTMDKAPARTDPNHFRVMVQGLYATFESRERTNQLLETLIQLQGGAVPPRNMSAVTRQFSTKIKLVPNRIDCADGSADKEDDTKPSHEDDTQEDAQADNVAANDTEA